jgi:hypothetical protein
MNPSIRHTIDDTEQIRPHMRLCHRMLSEALAAGFTAIELATVPGGTPAARALSEGSWKPFMASDGRRGLSPTRGDRDDTCARQRTRCVNRARDSAQR